MKVTILGVKKDWKFDFADEYSQIVTTDRNRGPLYELVPAEGCPECQVGTLRHGLSINGPQLLELGKRGSLVGEALRYFKQQNGFKAG